MSPRAGRLHLILEALLAGEHGLRRLRWGILILFKVQCLKPLHRSENYGRI
jgi:hypothetical protein